jgi:hypothetical protein
MRVAPRVNPACRGILASGKVLAVLFLSFIRIIVDVRLTGNDHKSVGVEESLKVDSFERCSSLVAEGVGWTHVTSFHSCPVSREVCDHDLMGVVAILEPKLAF